MAKGEMDKKAAGGWQPAAFCDSGIPLLEIHSKNSFQSSKPVRGNDLWQNLPYRLEIKEFFLEIADVQKSARRILK